MLTYPFKEDCLITSNTSRSVVYRSVMCQRRQRDNEDSRPVWLIVNYR
ncbi:hypothetical protein CCUG62472_04483 [Mycobacteroides salmoniphilum]|nr:hypothetical protein CCUG62472_04483 [Mycobacteroides salmoniphilum]